MLRQSAAPLPPEPQQENVRFAVEDFEGSIPVERTVPVRPKRRRGNDSVSHSRVLSTGSRINQFLWTDEDGDLALPSTDNTG